MYVFMYICIWDKDRLRQCEIVLKSVPFIHVFHYFSVLCSMLYTHVAPIVRPTGASRTQRHEPMCTCVRTAVAAPSSNTCLSLSRRYNEGAAEHFVMTMELLPEGVLLLSVATDPRAEDYTYTRGTGKRYGKKFECLLVSSGSNAHCLGQFRRKGKEPAATNEFKAAMEKFTRNSKWHVSSISLVKSNTKVIVDMNASTFRPVLQSPIKMPNRILALRDCARCRAHTSLHSIGHPVMWLCWPCCRWYWVTNCAEELRRVLFRIPTTHDRDHLPAAPLHTELVFTSEDLTYMICDFAENGGD